MQALVLLAVVLWLRPLDEPGVDYVAVSGMVVLTAFAAVAMGLGLSAAFNTPPRVAITPPRQRSVMAFAAVLAVLVLAGGTAAAALIVTREGPGNQPPAATSPYETRTTTASGTAQTQLEPFTASTYSAEVPRGWHAVRDDEEEDEAGTSGKRRRVSEFQASGDPLDSARKLDRGPAGY